MIFPRLERSLCLSCRLGEAKCLYRLPHPVAGVVKGFNAVDTDYLPLDELGQDAPRGINGSPERFVLVYNFLPLRTRFVLQEEQSEIQVGRRCKDHVRRRKTYRHGLDDLY